MTVARLLLVEDSETQAIRLRFLLEERGYLERIPTTPVHSRRL